MDRVRSKRTNSIATENASSKVPALTRQPILYAVLLAVEMLRHCCDSLKRRPFVTVHGTVHMLMCASEPDLVSLCLCCVEGAGR